MRRGALLSSILLALAACDRSPRRVRADDAAERAPSAEPSEDAKLLEEAVALGRQGDPIAAHSALAKMPASSPTLDDPRVTELETAWAGALLARIHAGTATDPSADLQQIAATPRVDGAHREQALRELAELARAAPNGRGGGHAQAGGMVASLAPRFRSCYNRGLATNPTIAGGVSIRVRLSPTGSVLSTAASSTGNLPPTVVDCVREAVANATFAAPDDPKSTTLVIPVSFRPQ